VPKRGPRSSRAVHQNKPAQLAKDVLRLFGVKIPAAAGRMPCLTPFLTKGSGVANIPPGGVNKAVFDASEAGALRDAFATARRICATNPDCPNPLLVMYIVTNVAPRLAPPRIVTDVLAVWMCVPMNPSPQWWESPGGVKPAK
jgi:hypothetical protein